MFAYIGIDKPGIVDRYIVKGLRQAYAEDKEFKAFIDHLNPEAINDELYSIYSACAQHDPRLGSITKDFLASLFTLDSVTFWQNMLQVPKQLASQLSEEWGVDQYRLNGLINIRRPKGPYWLRNDFRRYLAPIHFSLNNKTARLFYGNGHVKLIGEKPR